MAVDRHDTLVPMQVGPATVDVRFTNELERLLDRYVAHLTDQAVEQVQQQIIEQVEPIVRKTILELLTCGFLTENCPAVPDLVEHCVAMLKGK